MVLSIARGVAWPFLLSLLSLASLSQSLPERGWSQKRQVIRLVEPLGLAGMQTLSPKDIKKDVEAPKSDKERLRDAALRFLDHYQPFLGVQSRSYKNRKATLQPFAYPPYFDSRIKPRAIASSGKLVASPSVLEIGQDVTVTFTGITPQTGDFIAIYCPPNPEKGPGDYIDTVAVDPSNSGTNPPNTVQFSNLMNMRCDYAWNYIQNSTDGTLNVLASSNAVTMKGGYNQPLQGHLSYLGSLSYAVTWNNGNNLQQNEVLYGTDQSSLSLSSPATSWTYAADSMCGPPANTTAQMFYRNPGYMHSARLSSLSPRTTYYYKFGNSNDGYSSIYSFTTAPDPQASTANVTTKFIALADMGVDPNAGSITAARVTNEVVANGFKDFLLHFGDISYARGNAYTWEQFFELIQPYATRTPYQVSVGNHEYDHEEGGEKDLPRQQVMAGIPCGVT